jgi:c-di-GMP-specific phosphodiesterase
MEDSRAREDEQMLDQELLSPMLRLAEQVAHLSPWSWDVEQDLFWCLPDLFSMNGLQRPSWATDDHKAIPVRCERWLATLAPHRRERMRAFGEEVVRTGIGGEIEYPVTRGDSIRWLSVYAAVGETVDGTVRRVVGYTQDVTAHKVLEMRFEQAKLDLERQLQAVERIAAGDPLDQTLDQLCRHVERMYPGAFCSVMLLDPEIGVLGHTVAPSLSRDYLAAMDGIVVAEGSGACGTSAALGKPVIVEDIRTDPLMVSQVDVLDTYGLRAVWSQPLRSVTGEILGTLAVYRTEPHAPSDVEIKAVASVGTLAALAIARDRIQVAIQANGNIHPPTGLANRSRFLELVNERLAEPGDNTAVLFVEVERFKYLVDDHGHAASASILAEVARRLRAAVGSDGIVGRFSGDEFTIATAASSREVLTHLVTRVQEEVTAPITVSNGELFLSATVGAALVDGSDAYGLVREAAAAMQAARLDGIGGHRVYSRKLRTQSIDLISHESELRRAIDFDEIVLHYQPILDIVNHRWDRLEALARWNHPTRGLLAPSEFIPMAEKSGLIVPLGQRVLKIVAQQALPWVQAMPGLRIAVNFSVLELAVPGFTENVLRLLDAAGMSPHAINVEVGESGLIQKLDTVGPVLEDLRAAGMRIVVQEFGTGYSSLAHLGELPVTSLKVDRSFIAGITTDTTSRTVVRSIVDIARAHGLTVAAEGIEDPETLAAVRDLGCHYAQGFHLAMPAPGDELGATMFETSAGLAHLHVVSDPVE